MRSHRQAAFTLFELLLALALLAILFAFLLPAVLKVRMAASRAQSFNNLKQIALACHNYHDVNGSFPPGNDGNHFSAAARLLPYLEQDNLYKQLDFKKATSEAPNNQAGAIRIPVFQSPRDPLQAVNDKTAATNYLFSAGSKPSLEDNDGVFFQNSKVRIQDITDGTSNTIMAGETLRGDGSTRAVSVQRQYVQLGAEALKRLKDETGVQDFKENKHISGDRCARWIDGRFLQGTFTGTRLLNDQRPDVSCGGIGGLSSLRSLDDHVGVAMCDGSVRALEAGKMKLDVWKLLTARNDGQVIPADF
jgi:prepilin-type N-terminal cleavage/methylation domain-containing protein